METSTGAALVPLDQRSLTPHPIRIPLNADAYDYAGLDSLMDFLPSSTRAIYWYIYPCNIRLQRLLQVSTL